MKMQKRVLDAISAKAEACGLDPSINFEYANIGIVYLQKRGTFDTVLSLRFEFQSSYGIIHLFGRGEGMEAAVFGRGFPKPFGKKPENDWHRTWRLRFNDMAEDVEKLLQAIEESGHIEPSRLHCPVCRSTDVVNSTSWMARSADDEPDVVGLEEMQCRPCGAKPFWVPPAQEEGSHDS